MTAIYRVDGNSVVTSPDAAGPWDRRMQHGSAPASLVTWAAERIPTPVPMAIARVTIDLMRPVPVAPLTIATEILREGRKIQLCEIKLLADGVQVVGATVLKIKTQAQALPDEVKELPVTLPSPEDSLVEAASLALCSSVEGALALAATALRAAGAVAVAAAAGAAAASDSPVSTWSGAWVLVAVPAPAWTRPDSVKVQRAAPIAGSTVGLIGINFSPEFRLVMDRSDDPPRENCSNRSLFVL